MCDRPVGIDLFAGVGGLSLGFEQAGFDIAAAVEIDPIHASAHHYNFPESTVVVRSVVGLTGDELRAAAGIGSRPVDVVFGGSPCQGFSLIGQRMLDDPRNELVREFVRLVQELGAKTFVFENVKGLTVGKQRQFLDAVISAFADAGYGVTGPWRVLNATHYGVPQDRQRLFLLGARNGVSLPKYPERLTYTPSEVLGRHDLPFAPTCFDALSDLPDAEDFEELLSSDTVDVEPWPVSSKFAQEARGESLDAWRLGYPRIWRRDQLTASMRSAHTEVSRRRFSDTAPGETEPISRFFKLHPDGISQTLRAGTDSSRGAFTSPRPIHYALARCITVREMARLHGYPDWFRFHVTKWHGARQVGNSVPPPLARAVASSIMKALGLIPNRPVREVQLGSQRLLTMDMREAAAFWGIPVPISGRDRSSGLRKRRQWEIEEVRPGEVLVGR